MKSEKPRKHEERFRCPQCGNMVTVSSAFRADAPGKETMVRFECTMEGLCGSPIWDPCPMYMAYMEHAPEAKQPDDKQIKKWAKESLKLGD